MNKIKETDYFTFCTECGEPLLKIGLTMIHPEGDCGEADGVKILIQHRDVFNAFQAKYSLPKEDLRKLVRDYNKLVDYEKDNGELNEELSILAIDNANWAMLYEKIWTVRFTKWLKDLFQKT